MPEAHFILSQGLFIAIFVMSIVLHEYAHGWMAAKCGDYTAQAAGRLTLNPLKHIDPVWSIIMPILFYYSVGIPLGSAKPVPINPYRFRNLVKGYRLVSIAGIATNLLIAIGFSLLLRLLLTTGIYAVDSQGTKVLGFGIMINLFLGTFNLVPIPPLDGSKILQTFLPGKFSDVFDRIGLFGIIIIVFLLMTGVLWQVLYVVVYFSYKYICFGPPEVWNRFWS